MRRCARRRSRACSPIRCVRAISELRVLIVVAYRPAGDAGGLRIEGLAQFEEIAVAELVHDEAKRLIRSRLATMRGGEADPPTALVDLVTARAQGNPFYIEELLNFIASQGVDPQD